ncbi:MAG: hypothetical protein ACRDIB_06900, partial [Ardenticatenaceae bacterium]
YVLDRYNEENYEKRRGYDPAQCRVEWGMVRRELQFAVRDLNPALLFSEMRLPWGARATPSALIEEMVAHEEEHVQDILAAIGVER